MRLPSLWNAREIADPFHAMRREMNDLFSDFARRWPSTAITLDAPAVDIAETKDAYEITAELPGVEQNDIKLAIDGNTVVISGEKKKETEQKDKNWHAIERSYGAFQRSVALPFEPKEDAVSAFYDKGVLRLTIKKSPAALQQKKTIEIKSGSPPVAAPPAKAA
jgi:HSP20 family protein